MLDVFDAEGEADADAEGAVVVDVDHGELVADDSGEGESGVGRASNTFGKSERAVNS